MSVARALRTAAPALALAAGPAVPWAAGPGGEAAPPLPWREPAPPARMFLQLPFEGAAVVEPRAFRAEVQLAYANSILVGGSPALSLDVDVESAELLGLFRLGLWRGAEAELGVPVIADYGGFLDGPIEAVERALGATPMPGRLDHPENQARFRLTRPDGSGIRREGAGAGLGDVWASLKARLLEGEAAAPALSLRVAAKAPTGRPPWGSGEVDLGASLSGDWAIGRVALRLQLDAIAPTASLRQVGLPTRPYGAGQVGASIPVSSDVCLHAQWAAHLSPFARTGLLALDGVSQYLVAGASVALSRSLELEVGAAENVFSPAWGADLTLLAGLRGRP